MQRASHIVLTASAALFAGSCSPSFDQRPSLVTEPVVLAVVSEPAESRPSTTVTLRLLVATPNGTDPQPMASWSFCTRPRPLAENSTVPSSCLGDAAMPLGGPAPMITAAVPFNACSLFGSEAPPGDVRAPAPDVTGGFYQPVRIALEHGTAFARQRLSCNLSNAPFEIVRDFRARYVANSNPQLGPLLASIAGAPIALDAIPPSAEINFALSWPDDSAQSYVVYDPLAIALFDRREAMLVSWYATAGAFDSDRTGRDGDDFAIETGNRWRAPEVPGTVHLWVVLRDDRGGSTFASYQLTVR